MSNKTSDLNANDQSISEFYEGVNILLTGATGFVGKVVLEKLLRSCKSSGDIYILIRPKKGLTPDERLQQLFQSPAFDPLRVQDPEAFKKVKLISGDLEQSKIGLSEFERNIITEKVNVVIHSAASVKLMPPLQTAIRTNTITVKRIIDLCKDIKHLKRLVYVSTAFVARDEAEEIVQIIPNDPDFIINCVENLPQDVLELIKPKLLGDQASSYTYSKALAEKLVLQSSVSLPTVIVRPPYVHSSWKEPFAGWTDSLSSITPLAMIMNQGTIKTLLCNKELVTDIMPVDIVANTIIAVAWHEEINSYNSRSSSTRVYNCTSGTLNSITYEYLIRLQRKHILEYPTQYMVRYPNMIVLKNKTIHQVAHCIYDIVPALMKDAYLYCTRREPRLLQETLKMARIMKLFEIPMTEYRNFHTKNFKRMIEAVNKAKDGANFNIDIRKGNGFNWELYTKDCQLGFRKHILKDDLSSLNYAKSKLKRFYWTSKSIQVASICLILGPILWKTASF